MICDLEEKVLTRKPQGENMLRNAEFCEPRSGYHQPVRTAFLKALSIIRLKIAELLVWQAWCSMPRTHRDEF
jgi:hypothetical protein